MADREPTQVDGQGRDTENEEDQILPATVSPPRQAAVSLQPAPSIRKSAGRRVGRIWEFVDGNRKDTHVVLKCCQGTRISSNATFIQRHVRSCTAFKRKFPAAVALFDPTVARNDASTDRTLSNQAVMQPTGPLEAILPKSQPSKQSTIGDYYKSITPAMAENFDFLYTNALLHDAMPFNVLS